jgi:hypothetical protein
MPWEKVFSENIAVLTLHEGNPPLSKVPDKVFEGVVIDKNMDVSDYALEYLAIAIQERYGEKVNIDSKDFWLSYDRDILFAVLVLFSEKKSKKNGNPPSGMLLWDIVQTQRIPF